MLLFKNGDAATCSYNLEATYTNANLPVLVLTLNFGQ